jgi:hypothetical protein
MTGLRRSRTNGNWLAVYGGPLFIGMLSLAGLLVSLLYDGKARYFSWIALATPVAVAIWFFIRRKRP